MVEHVPVRHMVGGSIPSLFAALIIACGGTREGQPLLPLADDSGDATTEASDSGSDVSGDEAGQLCQTSTEACTGLTGPVFYGQAYNADCSGEFIRERCVLVNDVYCCKYW